MKPWKNRNLGLLVIFALILAWAMFVGGQKYGQRLPEDTAVIEYSRPRLVLEPGDVICPRGKTCKWIAVDAETNKQLPVEKEK